MSAASQLRCIAPEADFHPPVRTIESISPTWGSNKSVNEGNRYPASEL